MSIFTATRARFDLPPGRVYLNGNSLGPPLRGMAKRVARAVRDDWAGDLSAAWSSADWVSLPARIGDRIAPLIGAARGTVTIGDTLTIRMAQALSAALTLRPGRRVVLTDDGNFPSDLYMAEELLRGLGKGHRLVRAAPEEVAGQINADVAVLMLTEVDFRTARRHDMGALTRAAHDAGALVVWDLAHSAGAVAVNVAGADADFAAGCTYKYLNGGPGAPAFVYVAPRHAETARPILAGWFGDRAPFAFRAHYEPAPGAAGWRIGTPPILSLVALDHALDVWDEVTPAACHARAAELAARLIRGARDACPSLALVSPPDPAARGSHLAFRHPQAQAIHEALAGRGVLGDVRRPDILRLAITPLYLGLDEIDRAVDALAEVAPAPGHVRRRSAP